MLQEMILQNRNHPSIILWGVRINESVDDDAFYNRTNKIAHQLDPSRATSGVRYHRLLLPADVHGRAVQRPGQPLLGHEELFAAGPAG